LSVIQIVSFIVAFVTQVTADTKFNFGMINSRFLKR